MDQQFYKIHSHLDGEAITIKSSKCLSLISVFNVNLHQTVHGPAVVHGLHLK